MKIFYHFSCVSETMMIREKGKEVSTMKNIKKFKLKIE